LLHVEKRDDVEVQNLTIKAGSSITASLSSVDEGSFVELINAGSSDVLIDEISYDVYNLVSDESREVTIKKEDFNDFFLINGTYARAYSNHHNY
jgi:hypothetical protein